MMPEPLSRTTVLPPGLWPHAMSVWMSVTHSLLISSWMMWICHICVVMFHIGDVYILFSLYIAAYEVRIPHPHEVPEGRALHQGHLDSAPRGSRVTLLGMKGISPLLGIVSFLPSTVSVAVPVFVGSAPNGRMFRSKPHKCQHIHTTIQRARTTNSY